MTEKVFVFSFNSVVNGELWNRNLEKWQDSFISKFPHLSSEKDALFQFIQDIFKESSPVEPDVQSLQEELQQIRTDLESAYSILDSVMENVSEVIFQADSDGFWTYLNIAWETFLGIPPYESIGNHFLDHIHPEDHPGLKIAIRWLMKGEKETIRLRFRFIDTNNQIKWVEFYAKSTFNQNKEINGFSGVILDISFQTEMENKLSFANEILERRVEDEIKKSRQKDAILQQQSSQVLMGQLLQSIAHQWRQPMNTISLAASDIMLDLQFGESQETINGKLEKIILQTKIMSKTIDHFLTYYQGKHQFSSFPFKELVDNITDLLQIHLYKNKIIVQSEIDENLIVHSYKNDLQQVLVNIINNSLYAFAKSSKSEKLLQIIAKIQEDDRLEIVVIDNAGGIPPEILGKVFDIYFSGYNDINKSGIGLYFCKQIIETNLKGFISLMNFNDGVKVQIQIPNQNMESAV
ncbi:MAG: PAS domain-containing protein [Leptospiraceae bacterium]|nr:PAS domain-containing protein [Leptospiraceae bacterium]